MRQVIKRLFRNNRTEHDLPIGYKPCGILVSDNEEVFGLFLVQPRNRIMFVRLFWTSVGEPVEPSDAHFMGTAYINGDARCYWVSDV